KVAPPFKECEFDIMYGQGISRVGEVLDLAVELDIVKKGGAWFSYNETKLGQGRDNAKEVLKNDTALRLEIEEKIKENAQKLAAATVKSKAEAKLAEAAKAASQAAAAKDDVSVSADDDFEEFAPAGADE
ncbi:MAG: DNA recombination/repair protein RecA, partial [Oscillospiraceae bacterium]|nr:DNA recombination/repair protein RecA [Oscillospiraceae bacterium]